MSQESVIEYLQGQLQFERDRANLAWKRRDAAEAAIARVRELCARAYPNSVETTYVRTLDVLRALDGA